MPLTSAHHAEFCRRIGSDGVRDGTHHTVQGRTPTAVLLPATLEEAAACARLCFEESLAVAPWGGGTQQGFGAPPERLDVVLSTARLAGLVDYEPADMTVTVQGGMPLAKLQRTLGEQGQYLPLDPPLPERATLGGITATRDTGALRQAFGSPRDLLIGLRVVDPEGEIVRGGSKVVKNVAGYDLPKLYAGSWGTLGLLAELTFRVLPLPEASRTVSVAVPNPSAVEEVLARSLDSDLSPVLIELLNAPASLALGTGSGWTLVYGFDGHREDVDWQIEALVALCRSVPGAAPALLDDPLGRIFRQQVADFGADETPAMTLRVSTPGSMVAAEAARIEDAASARRHEAWIAAHAGAGMLEVQLRGESGAGTLAMLEALRAESAPGVRITVERAAADLVGRYIPWADAGDGRVLMETLRGTFDPKRLWNPGRFVV